MMEKSQRNVALGLTLYTRGAREKQRHRLGRLPCLDYCQISVKRAGDHLPRSLYTTFSPLLQDFRERARQDSNLRPSDS